MATELRPFGVRCNIACRYCYQGPTREQLRRGPAYDLDKMLAVAAGIGLPITIFGGEPLLLPIADLEVLFAAGRDRLGGVSIQTNGALISDVHIGLFQKYSVRVGVSIDGPGDLNELRWAHSAKNTAETSALTMQSVERLCAAGLNPSIIVTLHRMNAGPGRLPSLLDWIREIDTMGVRFIRLHLLESESGEIRDAYGLSQSETASVFRECLRLEGELRAVRIDIFSDIRAGLDPGADGASACVWNACDPYTTAAVQGIEGDGTLSNCGRTNKEGIEFAKALTPSFERYLALYQTPQRHGGCQGCRFFIVCKGHCPGTAIDGDWRNRTEHCQSWFEVMEMIEGQLKALGKGPLSLDERRPVLEKMLLAEWAAGRNPKPAVLLQRAKSAEASAAS